MLLLLFCSLQSLLMLLFLLFDCEFLLYIDVVGTDIWDDVFLVVGFIVDGVD